MRADIVMTMNALWADPRGAYAILALLALAVLGAAIAPGGLFARRRRASRIVAAAVLVGAALSLVWPQLTRGRALDANPASAATLALAGTWRDGSDTLVLLSDGAYGCAGVRCTGFGARGTWRRGGDALLVARWSDGREVPWNIVTYRGRYRLALLPERGGDTAWEGRLFYERLAQ